VEDRIHVEKLILYEDHNTRSHYYKHADWKRLVCV